MQKSLFGLYLFYCDFGIKSIFTNTTFVICFRQDFYFKFYFNTVVPLLYYGIVAINLLNPKLIIYLNTYLYQILYYSVNASIQYLFSATGSFAPSTVSSSGHSVLDSL